MPDMTIGGNAVTAADFFDVVDPCTGESFTAAPSCTPAQLDDAMHSAAGALRDWQSDDDQRRNALVKLSEVITAAAEELTDLLVSETGKPRGIAASEPAICDVWLRYYAGMDVPREVLQDNENALIELAHRPLGVVAAITPWNFPLGLAMWKIAPALRAGNTIVLKPSPFTPLATLRLGELANDVLPPGVLNVITGGDDLGAAMTAHPTPRKVTFTGSVSAGKKVAISSAADLKRVTLELGGNDAAIVLDDVDVQAVAASLVGVAFFNTGQACALPKRIYADERIYDDLVGACAAVAGAIKVGPSSDAQAQLGPLSTRPQFDRVKELVADAVAEGLRPVAGGASIDGPGYFFEPTILAEARDGVRIVDEEQFGPALPILRFNDLDDAIARANNTTFGLCGSVWSADDDRAAAAAERLECGTTFVNTHAALQPDVQFGGSKWSGAGLENGVAGLLSFTEQQVVHRVRRR
jgi:acyl-CoA reductase-like NAD-dependent aldehyde dehydrogenase